MLGDCVSCARGLRFAPAVEILVIDRASIVDLGKGRDREGIQEPRGVAAGSVYPGETGMAGHRATGLFAHITWHTWQRERVIDQTAARVVTNAIARASERQEVHLIAQSVLADHVHILVSFKPDRALAPFIRDAKSESARRASADGPACVRWARGYFVGSVSQSHLPAVRRYIALQFQRHPDLIPIRVD